MRTSIFPDEFVAATALIVVAASLSALGCAEESTWSDPGPEATFERFLMDWYRGDRRAAFEAIVAEDRELLTRPLDELGDKLDDDHLPARSDMLVVGRVDNPYDLEDVELKESLEEAPEAGRSVTLVLEYHDGRRGEATLVWGGKRWFVDLPLSDAHEKPDE